MASCMTTQCTVDDILMLKVYALSQCKVLTLLCTLLYLHVCRVCEINSVDGSTITSYCVHECEAANRVGIISVAVFRYWEK